MLKSITGGCAVFAVSQLPFCLGFIISLLITFLYLFKLPVGFTAVLRNHMMALASAAFGSLMFTGTASGVIGGGMISLGGFMNGTLERATHAACMYKCMFGLFCTVVRLHFKKRCEPGSKVYGLVEKIFKPAFEYNVKLELLARGKEIPKKVVKGPDGLPLIGSNVSNTKPRRKWTTQGQAKRRLEEAKKKQRKVIETKSKAIAIAA